MTDPIADLLTRIRNAEMASHEACTVPHSIMKESIVVILKKHKFIENFKVEEKEGKKNILITLVTKKTFKTNYKRISKPGQRIYKQAAEIKRVKSGLGIAVYSTPKGVIDNYMAHKENVGGELLCEIW